MLNNNYYGVFVQSVCRRWVLCLGPFDNWSSNKTWNSITTRDISTTPTFTSWSSYSVSTTTTSGPNWSKTFPKLWVDQPLYIVRMIIDCRFTGWAREPWIEVCAASHSLPLSLWFPHKESTKVGQISKLYHFNLPSFNPYYRGPASDWYEAIQPYLLYSMKIRRWFVDTVFLQHRGRFCEYLLECPSVEVKIDSSQHSCMHSFIMMLYL